MSRRRSSRLLEQLPTPIPPIYCPSGKWGYHTREDAQAWLRHLRNVRKVRGSEDGRVESREYLCALAGCNGGSPAYHLTSDSQRRVTDQRDEEAS